MAAAQPSPLLAPKAFVLATGNAHKVGEFTALLAPQGIRVLPAPAGYSCTEDGLSFASNALKKALAVQRAQRDAGLRVDWALADDSGIEVDALGGAPGIHSARYSELGAQGCDQDAANRAKLLQALKGVAADARTAQFVCALVALPPATGAEPIYAVGTLRGWVTREECGAGGFGYDSLFVPVDAAGKPCGGTLAQLGATVKDAMSHRSQALAALLAKFARAS